MEADLRLRSTTIDLFRLSRTMTKTLDTVPIISLIRLPQPPKIGDLQNISILEREKMSHQSHRRSGITHIPPRLK